MGSEGFSAGPTTPVVRIMPVVDGRPTVEGSFVVSDVKVDFTDERLSWILPEDVTLPERYQIETWIPRACENDSTAYAHYTNTNSPELQATWDRWTKNFKDSVDKDTHDER